MKAFVGLLILIGIQKLACLEMYWSHKYLLIYTPSKASIMPRVRFEQLFCFLHLCSNSASVPSTLPGGDRLFKVRKYLDLITARRNTTCTKSALHDQVQRSITLQTIHEGLQSGA